MADRSPAGQFDARVGALLEALLDDIHDSAVHLGIDAVDAHGVLSGYDDALAGWFGDWLADSGERLPGDGWTIDDEESERERDAMGEALE